jgi:hypothetical protein
LRRSWSLLGIAAPLAGGCTPGDGASRGRCDHTNSVPVDLRYFSFEEGRRNRDVTAKEFNGFFVSDVARLSDGKCGWFICPDCLSP